MGGVSGSQGFCQPSGLLELSHVKKIHSHLRKEEGIWGNRIAVEDSVQRPAAEREPQKASRFLGRGREDTEPKVTDLSETHAPGENVAKLFRVLAGMV